MSAAVGEPIRVAGAEVMEVRLPLLEPFVTGFGSTDSRRTVLVRVEDEEGRVGWGEAAALDHPFYLPETSGTAFEVIREFALPLALAAAIRSPADAAAALAPIRGNSFARAGVEAAFWVLEAARSGRSLRAMVGGTAGRVAVGESIGIKPSIEDTVAEVDLRVREGYRRIKLKIRPDWDLEVVRAVRDAFPDVPLQVDANGAYTLDAAGALTALDAFDLLCIEQPLAYDDLWEHARLQRRLRTPVCLDESLRSPADVRAALDLGACRNVNLKPGRVGGIAASLAIHDLCVERGIPLWCGGMLESGIGRAPNIALCSLPGFTQPADMSPASVLFADDLIDPTYRVDQEGCIAVPDAPGLGYPVLEERIRERTLRHARVPVPGPPARLTSTRKERV